MVSAEKNQMASRGRGVRVGVEDMGEEDVSGGGGKEAGGGVTVEGLEAGPHGGEIHQDIGDHCGRAGEKVSWKVSVEKNQITSRGRSEWVLRTWEKRTWAETALRKQEVESW